MNKYNIMFVIIISMSLSNRSSADITSSVKALATLATGLISFIRDMIEYQMGEVKNITPSQMQEYDFVIVGAGSAGATLAARLTENPNIKVLLIEAGGHEYEFMRIPFIAILLLLDPLTTWDYKAEPSNEYCLGMTNQQCYLTVGKVLGGCSSGLDHMVATRGHKNNFNEWSNITKDSRWSYENVLRYFKKLENFQDSLVELNSNYHNFDGPVSIVNPRFLTNLSHAMTNAGKELGLYPGDYNGANQTGIHYIQTNHKNGQRVSANDAYLRPNRHRPNLHVSLHSHVTKVLIDPQTKTAYGVEFVKRKFLLKHKIRVRASKEVIVSAGGLSTPKILMHSGIGPADHLRDFNITVLKDSPVGKNLMDHITFMGMSYLINETAGINFNTLLDINNYETANYFKSNDRSGPLTSDLIENIGFINVDNPSNEESITNMEFAFLSIQLGYTYFTHLAIGITDEHWKKYFSYNKNKPGWLVAPTLLQPKSRGEVLLRSTNPFDSPKVLPNYLSHPEDIRVFLKGIRLAIEVGKSKAMQRYNSTLYDKPIPGCEQHEWNSDNYWICAVRTYTTSFWHYSGTCRMGSKDDNSSVVDSELKVKGILNLRVVDGSVMPTLPSGHTNIPITMISELAADILKEAWKI